MVIAGAIKGDVVADEKKLIDMRRTEEDQSEIEKEYPATSGAQAKGPRYPWGLSMTLENEALKKLALKKLPAVGSKMILTAEVEVSSVYERDMQGGQVDRGVGLQITKMGFGNEEV